MNGARPLPAATMMMGVVYGSEGRWNAACEGRTEMWIGSEAWRDARYVDATPKWLRLGISRVCWEVDRVLALVVSQIGALSTERVMDAVVELRSGEEDIELFQGRDGVNHTSITDQMACAERKVAGEDASVTTYYCRTRMDGSMARNTPRGKDTEG